MCEECCILILIDRAKPLTGVAVSQEAMPVLVVVMESWEVTWDVAKHWGGEYTNGNWTCDHLGGRTSCCLYKSR